MISDMRSLKISIQILGILYITPTTTFDAKLKTFLSISINNDSISPSKYSRSDLLIYFISFLIYKDTPPPRRCFLKRFIRLYFGILYRSCLLSSSHVSVRQLYCFKNVLIPKQHAVREILCSRIKLPTARFFSGTNSDPQPASRPASGPFG